MKRTARVALLGLIAVLMVMIGGRVLLATRALAEQPCNANDSFPGWLIVVVCLATFGLGGGIGRLRDSSADRDSVGPGALAIQGGRRALWNSVVIHLILTLLLLSILLVLAYETVGLRNPWGLRPITSYVRCAKTIDPWTTIVAASAVTLLAGHWLWHPTQRAE